MRKLVVSFVIVVVAALAATDPIMCPDGCTDDAHPSCPGACLSCQHAILSVEAPELILPLVRIDSELKEPVLPSLVVALDLFDHPPRVP